MDPMLTDFLSSSSSSSSSSGSESDVLNVIFPEVLEHNQKNESFAEETILSYTDDEFLKHFKYPRSLLSDLAAEFEQSEYYPKKDTGFNRIPSEKCMWVFCWFATHEAASFRDVADRFNIALSTLHLIVDNVANFLSFKSNEVITWPNENEQEQIAEDFRQIGFPGVIGCLDGTHIKLDKPEVDPDSYLNRKKYYSIQVQAVCDSKKRIRDVFIGYPGSVHDARVFKNSSLFQSLPNKCGNDDRYIIADSAYPCLKNLLTPYRDNGNLNDIEKNYNAVLSHARNYIEHTFGILKQKCRQLYHLKLRNITSICHFVRACCVLHNLSRTMEDTDNYEGSVELAGENDLPLADLENDEFEGNAAGHNFRNYIAALLYNL